MALTREFKLTVRARVQRDAAFREELLREVRELVAQRSEQARSEQTAALG